MITEKVAAAQIARLSCIPFWSALAAIARLELISTLAACCDSPEHAKAVIDEWLNTQRELPTPADLRAIARATKPEPQPTAFRGYAPPQPETPEQIAEGIAICHAQLANLEKRHGPLVADLICFWRKELTRLGTLRLQNVSECAK